VILYQLLTRQRPYELSTTSFEEMARTICDQQPERPSVAARAAGARGREIDADLDNIALKALHKEPQRRYASAEQLADDIARYLGGLPVIARADTWRYRTGKFLIRHKLAASAALALVVSLGAGMLTTRWQKQRAELESVHARTEARRTAHIRDFLRDMLEHADPDRDARDVTVRSVLDRAAQRVAALGEEPDVRTEIETTLGLCYLNLGLYDAAERHLRSALEQREATLVEEDPEVAISASNLAAVLYAKREFMESEALLRRAVTAFDHAGSAHRAEYLKALNNLGAVLRARGELGEAEPLLRRALEGQRRLHGERHLDVAETAKQSRRSAARQGRSERRRGAGATVARDPTLGSMRRDRPRSRRVSRIWARSCWSSARPTRPSRSCASRSISTASRSATITPTSPSRSSRSPGRSG
jgi:serine/threonine-protein kinase